MERRILAIMLLGILISIKRSGTPPSASAPATIVNAINYAYCF